MTDGQTELCRKIHENVDHRLDEFDSRMVEERTERKELARCVKAISDLVNEQKGMWKIALLVSGVSGAGIGTATTLIVKAVTGAG